MTLLQDDSGSSISYDIEADSDIDENKAQQPAIMDSRTCRKTSYPHIFQLYMFSNSFLSPGTFAISSSNKYYWQRISESHEIPLDALEREISELNRCVFWYMFIPKLLWIIPWLCLPIGVVIYAVEDGFEHDHPDASTAQLKYHLYWSYNGLFLFVGGGIGGVLLATQLWSHCWYQCIRAMAKKINDLNTTDLWLFKYCVNFDIQCDIPVLAGRSYGRAYYKIVITMHHEYLHQNAAHHMSHHASHRTETPPIHAEPAIISLKAPTKLTQTKDRPSTLEVYGSMLQIEQRNVNESNAQNVDEIDENQMNVEQKEEIPVIEREMNRKQNVIEVDLDHDKISDKKVNEKEHRIKRDKNDRKSSSAFMERSKLLGRNTLKDASSSSLFNVGGFVSKSVLNDKSRRATVHKTKLRKRED